MDKLVKFTALYCFMQGGRSMQEMEQGDFSSWAQESKMCVMDHPICPNLLLKKVGLGNLEEKSADAVLGLRT